MNTSHSYISRPQKSKKNSFGRLSLLIVVVLMVGMAVHSRGGNALSEGGEIRSGDKLSCIDIKNDSLAENTIVQVHKCNNKSSQQWLVSVGAIMHDAYCLSVKDNGITLGSAVVISKCTDSAGQIWLADKGGYYNPNSMLCLSSPETSKTKQLTLDACSKLKTSSEMWNPSSAALSKTDCEVFARPKAIACAAEKEWTAWQSTSDHMANLDRYTLGSAYEAWCADFVSYVYRESGHPFTSGQTDGWDESLADNVQNMGFTKHMAGSYTPKTGDVAYFNYPGGHVEIVISGGSHPTFIYGNSEEIDPSTQNGNMAANSITKNGTVGHVIYYLSPN